MLGSLAAVICLFCGQFRVVYAVTYDIMAVPSCSFSNNEYLDISSLECEACDDDSDGSGNNLNKVPNPDYMDGDSNALSCKCSPGYESEPQVCSSASLQAGSCVGFTCVSCMTSSNSSYSDSSSCVSCGSSTNGLDTSTGDCACPTDGSFLQVLQEVDAGGAYLSQKDCSTCADGTFVFQSAASEAGVDYAADLYTCQSCPDENMAFDSSGACSCETGYTITGVDSLGPTRCVSTTSLSAVSAWPESAAKVVDYKSLLESATGSATSEERVESLMFEHLYAGAAADCYSYTGASSLTACQTLANLCVLQQYSPDSEVCDLFATIADNRVATSHSTDGWAQTMPWLYYADDATGVRTTTALEMSVSFSTELQFKLAKYALNGTWMGLVDLDTMPYYCGMEAPLTGAGGGSSRSTRWLQFGYSWQETFTCDLATLLGQEQYLYDPYLYDSASGTLYPVPVLVTNYVDGSNDEVNLNTESIDELDDQLTRRFFFFDVSSGVSEDTTSTTGSGAQTPSVMRYASDITLTIEIQKNDPDKIYPPLLTMTYVDVRPGDWETTLGLQTPNIHFKVEYTMSTAEFWGVVRAFFAVGMVLTGLTAAWRLRNWHVRRSRADDISQPVQQQNMSTFNSVDWGLLIQGSVLLMHTFVLHFGPFTFLICGYWFAFFKLQDTVFLMMPSHNATYAKKGEYYPLQAMIALLFVFQLVRVVHQIVVQCRVDLFFIDWEKSQQGPTARQKKGGGVSVWRQLMVTNEWQKLATQRRLSPVLTLMCLAFLLIALRLEYSATPQPDLGDRTEADLNHALRFANTTFWWLLLSFFQWLWVWGISERYLTEPANQRFIDMATMAKVSVLVLDEKYHGWYLHCRSPYPHADVPMKEMAHQLDNEESGLTTDRGVDGCPPQEQAFELFVTAIWRRKYDHIYGNFVHGTESAGQVAGGRSRMGAGTTGPQGAGTMRDGLREQGAHVSAGLSRMFAKRERTTHRMVQAAADLNSFLQGFVEQSYTRKELERSYREPAWLDRLLGNPPDMRQLANSPCIFYPDRWFAFSRTWFLGIEGDLLLLDIATYSVCDLWFNSTAKSILLTYLLGKGLSAVRAHFGRINVLRKTMLDERFLL